jgi:ribulose-phosphate 3-epimerase
MNHVLGVSGSVLNADPCFLGQAVQKLDAGKIDSLHFDIMDGHFVPEISWGTNVVKAARALTLLPFDVHLMVQNPEKYIAECANAKVYQINFHPASSASPLDLLDTIHAFGMKACVAVSPHEDPLTWALWEKADAALVMTVTPGKGGQMFSRSCLSKISVLKRKYPHLTFGVDGGINLETAAEAINAGADYLVCGSFLMKSNCLSESIHQLKLQKIRN